MEHGTSLSPAEYSSRVANLSNLSWELHTQENLWLRQKLVWNLDTLTELCRKMLRHTNNTGFDLHQFLSAWNSFTNTTLSS